MRGAISAVLLCAIAMAMAWSVLLARPSGPFRELVPDSVAELKVAALQMEYDGGDAGAKWEEIARRSPRDSASRIRLGLLAEQRGDTVAAERWLRAAYEVDHQFEPRWTLANFYFRQGRVAEFWTWIHSALEISYGDRSPAFDLCWHLSDKAGEVQTRAIPPRAEVAEAYLLYVLDRHPEAISGAARAVRAPELLLGTVDRLIELARFDEAVETWQRAGRDTPRGISGARFEEPQTGRGFDWRFARVEGVTQTSLDAGRGHRIHLTGNQPETAELLRQYAGGLTPGMRYQLRVESDGDAHAFEWRVGGDVIAAGGEFRASGAVVPITLSYHRPLGEMRAEGTLDLREVKLLAAQ